MLASTIQISNNNPTPPTTARIHARQQKAGNRSPGHSLIPQNPNSVSANKQAPHQENPGKKTYGLFPHI
jgi:hypothetical protein